MIALFPLNYCLSLHYAGYNWIASLATLGVGLAEIAFSLIFGRQVLGSEIKNVSLSKKHNKKEKINDGYSVVFLCGCVFNRCKRAYILPIWRRF